MADQEDIRLSNQLCFAVYNANRLFARFYQLALAPYKLTYSQYAVLLALWEQDGVTLKQLGRQLDLASNTLTPLLRRLESAGWIVRMTPATDKRQLIIRLTEAGRLRRDDVFQSVKACAATQQLSSDAYGIYLRHVQRLNTHLEQAISAMTAALAQTEHSSASMSRLPLE
ncbi:MAG: MarR family transcriptional regulator [Sporolactobacillus sp.]